jgi:hypothetical protein
MPEHQFECSDESQSHSLGFKLRSAREGKHPKQQNREFVCHRRTVHVLVTGESLSHSAYRHALHGLCRSELITLPPANRAICVFSAFTGII